MLILGIETSCDETGVALYDSEKGLLGHLLHSQISLHAKFGGVVPELASRDHIQKLLPLLDSLLQKTSIKLNQIEAIAYTAGPGLVGALLVGAAVAKTLAFLLHVSAIPVHHLEAHLLAPMLEERRPELPFVALLVSGGHTLLIYVEAIGRYRILGETLDDAAGEAFDKVARLLGLPYPGGAALAELASKGNPQAFHFPRPMVNRPGLDFSFSGLKTCALNTLRGNAKQSDIKANVARAFQDAVVDTMRIKCRRALKETGAHCLIAAGGVSANQALRTALKNMAQDEGCEVFYPRSEFCTDNAAMVAYAGWESWKNSRRGADADDLAIKVFPRWEIGKILENKNSFK